MAFATNSEQLLSYSKKQLTEALGIKLFGKLKSFLGWDIDQGSTGVSISQRSYVEELLYKHGLIQSNDAWSPLNADLPEAREPETYINKGDHVKYRAAIGELLQPSLFTRPGISFSVNALARKVRNPSYRQADLLMCVLR